ncbi:MAG: glycoside hydrolase family 3 N-terminal domain-containing protein [Pyrinomonadaceae bacterium]
MNLYFTKKIFALFLVFVFFQTWLIPLSAQSPQKFQPSERAWKWADKTLKKMSDDEKVGQLVHIGINASFMNQDSPEFRELKHQVVENKIGGIVLFGAPIYETVHLVNRMQEAAKIPLLISIDAETGVGMRFNDDVNFPWNMAIAATGNPDYARRVGVITGREAHALGIQQIYAPVLDVNNNPDNPVINVRSYGENPEDVARFGTAFIEGLQSQNVLATAKHFPGHGDTNVDSHRGLPIINVSRERLDKIELVPFKAAINDGVGAIMIGHISLPQIDPTEIKPLKESIQGDAEKGAEIVSDKATMPATLSSTVQTEILRKQLGFQGLIVTDAMSMSGLTIYFNQDEAAVRAVLAGADILEKPADVDATLRGLREAVKSGRISKERLNESVHKILAWKYQLGLEKNKITPLDKIDMIVASNDSRQLTNEIARQAITLVKNEKNNLPFKPNQKVAVLCITNGEDRFFVGNSFVGELRSQGIKAERIVLDERSTEKEISDATAKIKNSDIVIAGLFARVRSGAKNSIGLPTASEKVLRETFRLNKPAIGISFGNPYFLRDLPELETYIVTYGDMPSLQQATADAVTGKQNFYGKLPITIGNYLRGTGLQIAAR